jgi:hypothetical protein
MGPHSEQTNPWMCRVSYNKMQFYYLNNELVSSETWVETHFKLLYSVSWKFSTICWEWKPISQKFQFCKRYLYSLEMTVSCSHNLENIFKTASLSLFMNLNPFEHTLQAGSQNVWPVHRILSEGEILSELTHSDGSLIQKNSKGFCFASLIPRLCPHYYHHNEDIREQMYV